MFKNREIRISLDKTNKPTDTNEVIAKTIGASSANIINGVLKDLLKPTAITIVATVVAVKVVDTLCEIALKKS